jgi:hypothetical protein
VGTGGSRDGAGHPGWRRKCEQALALDIRTLSRKGHLAPGTYTGHYWSRGGEPCGSIECAARTNCLVLSYTRTTEGGEPARYRYEVPVERTSCRFGGSRPWFRCPWCNRRCAVIYGLSRDGYFACRICLRLAYTSECECPFGRLLRRMEKLEARLIDGELKPKGMRWRTFERICERIDEIDQTIDTMAFVRFAQRSMDADELETLFGTSRTSTGT